jgi:hypothetical protein
MIRSLNLVLACDRCGHSHPVEVSNWDGRTPLLDAPELLEALAEQEWTCDRRRGLHYCYGCTHQRVREYLEQAGKVPVPDAHGCGKGKKKGVDPC